MERYKWKHLVPHREIQNKEGKQHPFKPIGIGLSAKKGAGKSTIADQLVIKYGFVKFSFATRLKELCNELFPELMTQSKEDARWVLQKFGTDYCRHIKSTVWVDIIIKQIEKMETTGYVEHPATLTPYYGRIVVDDVRFKNEYFALKGLNFKMVRIERSPELVAPFGYDLNDPHISETNLDDILRSDWDHILQNDYKYPFVEAAKELAVVFNFA